MVVIVQPVTVAVAPPVARTALAPEAPVVDEEDGLIGGSGLEGAPVDGGGDAVDEEGA